MRLSEFPIEGSLGQDMRNGKDLLGICMEERELNSDIHGIEGLNSLQHQHGSRGDYPPIKPTAM